MNLSGRLPFEFPPLGFGFHLARPTPVPIHLIAVPPPAPSTLFLPVIREYRRGDPDAEHHHGSQDSPGSHAPTLSAAHAKTKG
jgi:hypothetical protein